MILLFSVLMTTMMTNKDIKTAHEMCPRNDFINGTTHASTGLLGIGQGYVGFPLNMPRIRNVEPK